MRGSSTTLQDILKLSNNADCFLRIKQDLGTIAKKHLDPNKTSSLQKGALKVMEEEILEKYPDFFDGEGNKKALKHAISYIKQRHGQWRHGLGLGGVGSHIKDANTTRSLSSVPLRVRKKIRTPKEEKNVLDENVPGTAGVVPKPTSASKAAIARELPRPPLVERMAQNLALYASQPPTNGVFAGQNMCQSTPLSSSEAAFISATQQSSSSTQLSMATANGRWREYCSTRPLYKEEGSSPRQNSSVLRMAVSSSQASTSASGSSSKILAPVLPRQIAVVYQFLHSCVPSLDHLLERFIDFGCSSEEYLLGVSMWPRERIEDFVNKLPPAADGMPMSPMEKLVLCNQFLSYFA